MSTAVAEPIPVDTESFRVRVPPHLLRAVKQQAADDDVTVSKAILGLAVRGLAAQGLPEDKLRAEWYRAQADALEE